MRRVADESLLPHNGVLELVQEPVELNRERARIARDIHDDLGAGLTQLVLLGEVSKSELPSHSSTRPQIEQICDKARDLSHAMDEVVWVVNSRRDTLRARIEQNFHSHTRRSQCLRNPTGLPPGKTLAICAVTSIGDSSK